MLRTQRRQPKADARTPIDLRVIGVGLPRTGTSSLKEALEILGFGPCHHMTDCFEKPERTIEFNRAYNGEKIDFHELMQGYGSTVDTPTVDFYKEIHQAYPQAKLILSVRDSGEKWFESFQNTIGSALMSEIYHFATYLMRSLRLQRTLGRNGLRKWTREYGSLGPSLHDQHNQRVISENKSSDLLVFNVKEGWEPLCRFLDVTVPQDIPFPNVNDTQQFKEYVRSAKTLGLCVWAGVGVIAALGIYLIQRNI